MGLVIGLRLPNCESILRNQCIINQMSRYSYLQSFFKRRSLINILRDKDDYTSNCDIWYTSCNSCCYHRTHHFHHVVTTRHYDPSLPYAITTFHYLLPLQHAFATRHCRTLLPHARIHFQFLTPCVVCYSVEIYQGRLSWFQDSQFLKDLENDSVDSDIIDEELGVLQEANTLT